MGSKQTPCWLLLACPGAAGLLEEDPVAEHQASLWVLLLLRSVIGSLDPRNLTKGRGGYSRPAPSLLSATERPGWLASFASPGTSEAFKPACLVTSS